MVESLQTRFQHYIKEKALFSKDDRILLTVSGGVDSMAMLSLFATSGYDIGVAHCNFGLRGVESDEDEVLVEQYAMKFGVPFYNKRFDTQGEMDRTGESVQIAARRLRYAWFDALCNEHDYNVIAIAHHADDSIETFFINLFRGTGLRGLTGISNLRGRIVRPLLFSSRKEILEYAHTNKIDFREDSSNRSTKYLRNKIRLGLIPRIREINPKFTELMSSNIQRLTDAQLFISAGVEQMRKEVVKEVDGITTIDPSLISGEFPVNFVIYEILCTYGFKGDVVDGLCRALMHDNSGKRFYAKEHVAYIDRGKILISEITGDDSCQVNIERHTHKIYCGNSVVFIEHLDIDEIGSLSQPENVALIDASKVTFPLTVRRWNEGDSFIPLGMQGHKKVSDMLIDCKVSMAEKQRQFVVCNGDEIVWLMGRRSDDRYKITAETESVIRLTKDIV